MMLEILFKIIEGNVPRKPTAVPRAGYDQPRLRIEAEVTNQTTRPSVVKMPLASGAP